MSARTNIAVSEEIHKKVKLRTVELGISLQQAADDAFERWLKATFKKAKVEPALTS
jgi:hypothetical protein